MVADDAIADRRKSAVPKALSGILLQGAHDMLGVLLRLIFVEERHDPPHHVVDRIVTELLRDGNEPDAVLGELPVVIFHVEGIAEEPRETVNQHHVKRCGLGRARFDHALELGPAIVGGGIARLIQLDREIFAAGFAGGLLPGRAELGGAGEDPIVGAALAFAFGGDELGLDVEGPRYGLRCS